MVQPRAGTPGLVGTAVGQRSRAGLDEQAVNVAVVAAGELDNDVAAGEPRAKRIALIVASVPELTIRTSSIDGTRLDDELGQLGLALRSWAPKLVPSHNAFSTASATRGWPWPRIIGPQEPT